jgi:hypothetical protein
MTLLKPGIPVCSDDISHALTTEQLDAKKALRQ